MERKRKDRIRTESSSRPSKRQKKYVGTVKTTETLKRKRTECDQNEDRECEKKCRGAFPTKAEKDHNLAKNPATLALDEHECQRFNNETRENYNSS